MEAFKSMSADELWHLHEEVTSTLARKIAEERPSSKNVCAFLKIPVARLAPIGCAVPIPRSFRNTRIQKIPRRNGPAVERNRIGCRRSSGRAKSSIIFSFPNKIGGVARRRGRATCLGSLLPGFMKLGCPGAKIVYPDPTDLVPLAGILSSLRDRQWRRLTIVHIG